MVQNPARGGGWALGWSLGRDPRPVTHARGLAYLRGRGGGVQGGQKVKVGIFGISAEASLNVPLSLFRRWTPLGQKKFRAALRPKVKSVLIDQSAGSFPHQGPPKSRGGGGGRVWEPRSRPPRVHFLLQVTETETSSTLRVPPTLLSHKVIFLSGMGMHLGGCK